MPSVADLRQQLKDQLASYDQQVKDLNASKADKLKEFNAWNAERQKDIKAMQADYANQLKGVNADFAQRIKDYNAATAAELKQRQADISRERDAAARKQMQADLAQWQKDRAAELSGLQNEQKQTVLNIQNSQKQDIANRNAEINQYKTDYNNWLKGVEAQAAQLAKDKTAFNATQNKTIQQRGAIETQAKKLDIDPDEYENLLANTKQYQQLKQEYKPYVSQLTENKTRDAAIAEIAKAQKIDPSILKNYFQSKEIEPLYTSAQRAQDEAKAQAEAQAKAAQEAAAARQAQMQQYAQEAAQLAQQRKGQNYAQMYNLLTQNMPAPVGYSQPATSQQARTTVLDAGGEGQGIMGGQQMSPAQIAQMSQGIMPQGVPLPPQLMQQLSQQQAARQAAQQQVAQTAPAQTQAPTPAKRGGIMGRY